MKSHDHTPAIVKPVADPAAALRAAFEAFQEQGRKRLEQAIVIGAILAEQKKACGHGNWLPWLAANFAYGRERAADFIRVYCERGKCGGAATFEEAIRLLATPTEPPLHEELTEESDADSDGRPGGGNHREPDREQPDAGGTDVRTPGSGASHSSPDVATGGTSAGTDDDTQLAGPSAAPDGEIDLSEYDLFETFDSLVEEDEEESEEEPTSDDAPRKRVPKHFKPGSQLDPNHPHVAVLRAFSSLSAVITKAIAADQTGRLKLYLTNLQLAKPPITPLVRHRALTIEGKHYDAQFVGLKALRRIVFMAGLGTKPLTAKQIVAAFIKAGAADAPEEAK